MNSMSGRPGALSLDDQGGVHGDPGSGPIAPETLTRAFEALLCAELSVIAARTVDTPNGHLAIMTLKERSGPTIELWAGAALRPDPATALCDAAADALLGLWHNSVVVAGAARLVAEGTCGAAMVIDERGVTTYGPPTDFPPLDGPGRTSELGARLAARTARGEFRALSLGGASVTLNVVPSVQHERRVERWFDALERARS
jgi:hypothetical protein